MKLRLTLLMTFTSIISVSAQYFVEENLSFSKKKGAYVITNAGERIDGEFAWLKFNRYSIKELALDVNGEKKKFTAEEIKVFVGVPSGLAKFSDGMDRATDINKLAGQDFEEVIKRDSSYFEQALIPRKKEFRMVQLLNPGFDSKIKVFKDPFGKETASIGVAGMKVAGGDEKSVLIKKEGAEDSMFLTKKNIDEEFKNIFGDCPKLMEYVKDKPNSIKMSNLAEFVFLYDQWMK